MSRQPHISDSEWEVMNVLWESSPMAANEVADAICERMDWHLTTLKTLLGRLVKKGALRYRQEGNRYLYRPAFPRERYVEAESRSFVNRVFGGKTTPALVHFVAMMQLSDDDLKELRATLEKKEKGEPRS